MLLDTLTVTHNEGQYPIYIGKALLSDQKLLARHILSTQVCVVTNTTVAELYLSTLLESLKGKRCDHIILADGEAYKTFESFLKIIDQLTERQHHRDTTLIALGGGVVGDMTGFAAACYHRGVAFIQIPTTLLAQVDASIGGKTAVNHPRGKNLVGAFYQPSAVVIDLDTLDTLPQREYNAGLAEIIKAALIKDAEFFIWLEENSRALVARESTVVEKAIYRACQIKQAVVMQDEKERGERALLNFGHTFGHAIEHCLGFGQWLHGEAVALGMLMAADLSCQRGLIDNAALERIRNILEAVGYTLRLPATVKTDAFVVAMQQDKKVYQDKLNLILLAAIGDACIYDDASVDELITHVAKYAA